MRSKASQTGCIGRLGVWDAIGEAARPSTFKKLAEMFAGQANALCDNGPGRTIAYGSSRSPQPSSSLPWQVPQRLLPQGIWRCFLDAKLVYIMYIIGSSGGKTLYLHIYYPQRLTARACRERFFSSIVTLLLTLLLTLPPPLLRP